MRSTGLFRRPLAVATAMALWAGVAAAQSTPTVAPGLIANGQISIDAEGVPTVVAQNDLDMAFLQGYIHARDRFFQMDFSRRGASGTVAELVGSAGLANDVQIRTLGLRRAAWESYAKASQDMREFLQAYANGVNHWIRTTPALPPEYGALELTRAAAPGRSRSRRRRSPAASPPDCCAISRSSACCPSRRPACAAAGSA